MKQSALGSEHSVLGQAKKERILFLSAQDLHSKRPAYHSVHAVSSCELANGNDFPNINCYLKFNQHPSNAMFFRASKNSGSCTRALSIAPGAHAISLRAYGQALLANQNATSHLCQSGRLNVRHALVAKMWLLLTRTPSRNMNFIIKSTISLISPWPRSRRVWGDDLFIERTDVLYVLQFADLKDCKSGISN